MRGADAFTDQRPPAGPRPPAGLAPAGPVPRPPAGPSPHRDPWQDGKRNATGGSTRDEPLHPRRRAYRDQRRGRRHRVDGGAPRRRSRRRRHGLGPRGARRGRRVGPRAGPAVAGRGPRRDRPCGGGGVGRLVRRGERPHRLCGHLPLRRLDRGRMDEVAERVFDINLHGPLHLVRSFMGSMAERGGGRIALVGSIAGRVGGLVAAPHYVMSKGAIHSFVRWSSRRGGAAQRPRERGGAGARPDPDDRGPDVRQRPLPARADGAGGGDRGGPLVFLVSPAASYISGAVLDINGACTSARFLKQRHLFRIQSGAPRSFRLGRTVVSCSPGG